MEKHQKQAFDDRPIHVSWRSYVRVVRLARHTIVGALLLRRSYVGALLLWCRCKYFTVSNTTFSVLEYRVKLN